MSDHKTWQDGITVHVVRDAWPEVMKLAIDDERSPAGHFRYFGAYLRPAQAAEIAAALMAEAQRMIEDEARRTLERQDDGEW